MHPSLLIFLATYFFIAVQRVRWLHLNRPAAALLGAVGMVTLGDCRWPTLIAPSISTFWCSFWDSCSW
jgi:hypothetical protein